MKNTTVIPIKQGVVKPGPQELVPPANLCRPARELWRKTVHQFELEPPALAVLTSIVEAMTLRRQAQRHVKRHGAILRGRFKQHHANPALAVIRDCDATIARGFRALRLDLEPVKGLGRPGGS